MPHACLDRDLLNMIQDRYTGLLENNTETKVEQRIKSVDTEREYHRPSIKQALANASKVHSRHSAA